MQISTQRQCQGLLHYFRTFLYHVWFLRPKFHFMAEMSPHKSVEWQSCRIPLSPETLHKWGAEGKPLHALALHGEPAGSLVGINLVWTCSNLVVCLRVSWLSGDGANTAEWSLATALQAVQCSAHRAGVPLLMIHQMNSPLFMARVLFRVINVRRVQHSELQASPVISAGITHDVNTTGKFQHR